MNWLLYLARRGLILDVDATLSLSEQCRT